jgi:hypothetical protein
MWSILAQQGQNGVILNTDRAYTWSLEYPHPTPRPSHPMVLPFPLVAPSDLELSQQYHPPSNSFLIPPVCKSQNLVSGTYNSTSTIVLSSKHSSANALYLQKVYEVNGEG